MDTDSSVNLSFPGSRFCCNPSGLLLSFGLSTFTTVCMSIASHILRKMHKSRIVLCGISLGGFFLQLMTHMLERSIGCKITLVIIDTISCMPNPTLLLMRDSDSIAQLSIQRRRLGIPNEMMSRNCGVACRSKSRLIYFSTAALSIRKPGTVAQARRLHEVYSVSSFEFEFIMKPDTTHCDALLEELWDIARKVRSEMAMQCTQH